MSSTLAQDVVASDRSDTMTGLPEMYDQLDVVWRKYLTNLDHYQTAHKQLQKQFAAGFFSLTQAKFKAQDGRRYGQDSYDERLKASRRVVTGETDASLVLEITSSKSTVTGSGDETVTTESKDDGQKQQPTPPATPAPTDEEPSPASEKEEAKPASQDPLRMFGILVPPSLRSAQTSFSATFDAPIAEAVNAARALRDVETDIRKLRKAIKKARKSAS